VKKGSPDLIKKLRKRKLNNPKNNLRTPKIRPLGSLKFVGKNQNKVI